jgi:hypothetical protein
MVFHLGPLGLGFLATLFKNSGHAFCIKICHLSCLYHLFRRTVEKFGLQILILRFRVYNLKDISKLKSIQASYSLK